MRRGPEQTFFQRRHTNGQLVHEKVLNITYHQRNANQKPNGYHLTSVRMAVIKQTNKQEITNAGEDVEDVDKGNTCTLLVWNVNQYNHYGKHYVPQIFAGSSKI